MLHLSLSPLKYIVGVAPSCFRVPTAPPPTHYKFNVPSPKTVLHPIVFFCANKGVVDPIATPPRLLRIFVLKLNVVL